MNNDNEAIRKLIKEAREIDPVPLNIDVEPDWSEPVAKLADACELLLKRLEHLEKRSLLTNIEDLPSAE